MFCSDQDIIIFRVATIVTLLVVVGAVAQAEWQLAIPVWLGTLPFPLTACTQQLTPRDIE